MYSHAIAVVVSRLLIAKTDTQLI